MTNYVTGISWKLLLGWLLFTARRFLAGGEQ